MNSEWQSTSSVYIANDHKETKQSKRSGLLRRILPLLITTYAVTLLRSGIVKNIF